MIGAFRYRIPPAAGAQRAGRRPKSQRDDLAVQRAPQRRAQDPQFWFDLVGPLHERVGRHRGHWHGFSDVAGNFSGNLIGLPGVKFNALSIDQKATIAAIAAGFTGLLSLFNIGGRFFWRRCPITSAARRLTTASSCSRSRYMRWLDIRRHGLEAAVCWRLLHHPVDVWRRLCDGAAYLADMFGTQFVGAIHGRLLTAWSTAGIIGRWW